MVLKVEKVVQDFLSIGNWLDCEKWVLVGGEEFKSGTDVNWKGSNFNENYVSTK